MVREPALPVVRRATAADVDAMAAQMARTFWDDPVAGYVFPKEARRDAGLRAYFGTQMRADYLPFGGCYLADGYAGSAIWAPAGKPFLTGLRGILTLVPVLPYVAANLVATLRLLNLVESLHPHEPHWYLASLGTAVDQQGKGIGGALMRPVLTHCDARGHALLSRVVQGAQRPLLPPARLRSGEGGAPSRGPLAVDHVARAAPGSSLSPSLRQGPPAPAALASATRDLRWGGFPRAWRGCR